jgi:3,5-epimerase/4-reductase
MKFLLYGAKGWIGSRVLQHILQQGIEVVVGNSRVNCIQDLEHEIQQIKPTHVISLIGRTHGTHNGTVFGTIDYLEQTGKLVENVRDNLFSPMALSILSTKYKFHFTYLGTGCIFEYDETHPFGKESNGFNETSLPNFFGSSYSIVKGFTDQLMHLFESTTLNVRIRMPITDEFHPRNFITKITTYSKVCSIPNSMTVLNELVPIMVDMAKHNITGTVNLTNPGLISHNEILEMYKEIVDPEFTWTNFSVEEQNHLLASGRSNNFLETTRLQLMYPEVKPIKESVREMLLSMAQRKES